MLSKEDFSYRLKTAINRKQIKQVDLAEMTGISPANISNYVKGKAFPPLDTLTEIAKVLNISLDWLCGITTPKSNADNQDTRTFGDIVQIISLLLSEKPPFAELTNTQVWDSGYEYDTTAIYFTNGIIRTFLEDLSKMQELLNRNTFDENFFKRWLEDRIHSLKYIPLNSKIYNIEDWMDTEEDSPF